MSMAIIAILVLIASIGTPTAPGAGAIILFTIPNRNGLYKMMQHYLLIH